MFSSEYADEVYVFFKWKLMDIFCDFVNLLLHYKRQIICNGATSELCFIVDVYANDFWCNMPMFLKIDQL